MNIESVAAAMNPLAACMLRRYAAARTYEERGKYEAALIDLGYWLMPRPLGVTESEMARITRCEIYDECELVGDFLSDELPVPGFDLALGQETIAVYHEKGWNK